GVVRIEDEELADGLRGERSTGVARIVLQPDGVEHVGPGVALLGRAHLEQAVVRHVQESGGALGALQVAAGPEQVLSGAGEHQRSVAPEPVSCSTSAISTTSRTATGPFAA